MIEWENLKIEEIKNNGARVNVGNFLKKEVLFLVFNFFF